MPMPGRGPRIRVTTRLQPDIYREAAVRAKQRGWTMSDYVQYCVVREIKGEHGHGRAHHGTGERLIATGVIADD